MKDDPCFQMNSTNKEGQNKEITELCYSSPLSLNILLLIGMIICASFGRFLKIKMNIFLEEKSAARIRYSLLTLFEYFGTAYYLLHAVIGQLFCSYR